MTRQRAVRICLVEDDPILGEALHGRLRHEGFEVRLYDNAGTAVHSLTSGDYDLAICDIRLPDMSGESMYDTIIEAGVRTPVMFITGYGTIEQAVRLLRRGAIDYFTKPLDIDRLLDRIRTTVLHARGAHGDDRLGLSPPMQSLRQMIDKVVPHPDMIVMIEGESGSGKEVVARLIHELGCPRSPFEAVNCAAIPSDLVASVLFGHEKGAFTGADRRFAGAFGRAGEGMLFLDEIGDMPLPIQVQLLRVIETRTFQPLGADEQRRVRCRIVCATHQQLEEKVRVGEFREDLFYRLGVVRLKVPPLRERGEDVLWLAKRFLADNAARIDRAPLVLDDSAREALLTHHWPGNVRELRNLIDRACLFCDAEVMDSGALGLSTPSAVHLQDTVRQSEAARIRAELFAHAGRIQETADALGISRKSLWQKMKRLDIKKPAG